MVVTPLIGCDGVIVALTETPTPLWFSVEIGDVKRISSYWLYDFGSAVYPLKVLPIGALLRIVGLDLVRARVVLHVFVNDAGTFPLAATKRAALNICKALDAIMWDKSGPQTMEVGSIVAWAKDPERMVGQAEADGIHSAVQRFEAVFDIDSGDAEIWAVKQIALYASRKLIDAPEEALSEDARKLVWENALSDFREAGSCLAFGRFTASGYHSLRCLESVIKQYVLTSTGKLPAHNRQNWGEYIDQLNNSGASPATVGTLRNVKDNHRNPLMHPEDVLDEREAISLFQLCGISIGELVDEMLTRGLTPAKHP